ncbi:MULTISPECIES: hypothetical protein [Kribbella]|uniref:hypothetical protein n=1 Tax=Kribbella TaxID=182639 RepID=UPI0018EEC7C4|nr:MULTISPECIES: hypothetical protein [Kribbella]
MIDYASAETTEILRAHAGNVEQNERPAGEGLDALRQDGVFALRTPQTHGGATGAVRSAAAT